MDDAISTLTHTMYKMPYGSVHKSRTSFLLFFPQTDVATVDLTADTV